MTNDTLAGFGWTSHFASQFDQTDGLTPVRVTAVHRNRLEIAAPDIEAATTPFTDPSIDHGTATVGDWLLVQPGHWRPRRLLKRRSLFKRRAPGADRSVQLIAANVDTLFIVSSCNQDFSIARLERYLALAREAEVMPVVLLTKADQAEKASDYVRQAARLMPGLMVEALDARDATGARALAPWCGRGQTVALVGSSGVGKSTLVNSLAGLSVATLPTRGHDDTGQHTTTGRSLHRLSTGGWLMDTPGMRELQLTDVGNGLDDVFSDLVELAGACRFSNCAHHDEPGCAVQAAVGSGELDPDRIRRWRKLTAEEAFNSASLAERRASEKAFSKRAQKAMRDKNARRS